MGTSVTWGSGPSSSTKLFLFMLPLVLVAGLVSVLGPSPSSWFSTAKPPLLLFSSVTSSAASSGAVTTPSEVKQREELLVVAVDNRAGENLISDDTHFNLSSTPPFSVQAIQQHVRPFSSFLIIIPPLSLPFFFIYMNHITTGVGWDIISIRLYFIPTEFHCDNPNNKGSHPATRIRPTIPIFKNKTMQ